MAVPIEHQEDLRQQIDFHLSRLVALQEQMVHIEREIAVHELVLAVANNDSLLPILEAISEDDELAMQACTSPRSFAEGRGLTVPQGIEVSASRSAEGLTVRATCRDKSHPFVLSWDQKRGFLAKHGELPEN